MNIFYLGPAGSYSEIIAKKMFSSADNFLVPVQTFIEIVEWVEQGGMGLLGIENSISSSVHESVDAVFQSQVYIVGEGLMNIDLFLGGSENSTIKNITNVYSHPQALAQCSEFIKNHRLTTHKTSSTASAVDEVEKSQDSSKGAIGGISSIKEKGMKIIAKNIGNTNHNMTRWVIISRSPVSLYKPINKVTYAFCVKHETGSLVRVLQSIADAKGNMTKIESRPVPGSNWEYEFWVDVEIPDDTLDIIDVAISENTLTHRRIGAYKKGILYTE